MNLKNQVAKERLKQIKKDSKRGLRKENILKSLPKCASSNKFRNILRTKEKILRENMVKKMLILFNKK